MSSLLITNDFPPKVGGIQTYLGELWRRLGPTDPIVLAPRYEGAAAFDEGFPAEIIRIEKSVLLPSPGLVRVVRELIAERNPAMVFVDPIVPLGLIGPKLGVPYVAIGHGAEIAGYARMHPSKAGVQRVLRNAAGAVVSGAYPKSLIEGLADTSVVSIPPGVDHHRFQPLDVAQRNAVRDRFGIPRHAVVVLGLSRLVPRKGFDMLLKSLRSIPQAHCVIAGTGRDRGRLEKLASPILDRVTFLGSVSEDDLPAIYGACDVFAMLCRERWRGAEAEGFGIVFLEAAACGLPAVAGRSGGSHEAVEDGLTGYVVDPQSMESITEKLAALVGNADLRRRLGSAARERAVQTFNYDNLVAPLARIAMGELSVFES